MSIRSRLILGAALGLALMPIGAGFTGAGAVSATVNPPVVVSVPDPFFDDVPPDCGKWPADQLIVPRNAPREPVIAINPVNPRNIVVSYIVDAFLSNLIRASFDGGRTWEQEVVVPGLSPCGRAFIGDPSLDFSADGKVLYLASLRAPGEGSGSEVVVNTSHDGARTWSDPTTLTAPDGLFGDLNFVTADASRPKTAYISYERHDRPNGTLSTVFFQRTDDGGKTWTGFTNAQAGTRSPVYTPTSCLTSTASRVSRAADGNLVIVFVRQILNSCPTPQEDNVVMAVRSANGGKDWSTPVKIGNVTAGPGTPRGTCDNLWANPQSAVGPDGTIFVSFLVDRRDVSTAPLATNLVVFKSQDGRVWEQVTPIAAPTLMGMPTLAVAHNGTVGMTYYQLERETCDESNQVAIWYAESRNSGRSWSTTKVTQPFNTLMDCGGCIGNGIADYDDLQPIGPTGFAAVFEIINPPPTDRPSDIFFMHISP